MRIRDLSHLHIDPIEFPSAGGIVRGLVYHAQRPATCVIICHGYSSAKHNVDPLAYHLAIEGYVALTFDFLGHKLGASSLPLAHARDLLTNVGDAIGFARSLSLAQRLVVAGHSMGAAAAIGAALRSREVSGVIAMSTAAKRGDVRGDEGLLRGLANRAPYVDGPDYREIAAVMDEATARIAQIAPRPLLVVAGEKDALVAPSATKRLFDEAGEPKTYELIDATHTDAAERARFVVVRWLRATGFEYATP